MRWIVVCVALTLGCPLRAESQLQKLLVRLAEEAALFEKTAPHLISEETLRQRAQKISRHRFRGSDDDVAPVWQRREIVSEYGFAVLGEPPEIREIRKVISVDGTALPASERGLAELLRGVQAAGSPSRKRLLEDFEKYGLVGTVTDFGQLLLLFERGRQELYTFSDAGQRLLGAERCSVFTYAQLDGPGSLTIWEGKGKIQSRASGEIWLSTNGERLMRITIQALRGEGALAVRDEADVDYTRSTSGVPIPAAVTHREYRNGVLRAENLFTYAAFRRFAGGPQQ